MRERKLLDLGAMVLVISETLKNLRTPEIRKGPSNLFHIAPKKKIGHHIVNSDACPFDSRISPAYARCFDNVTILGRRFHDTDYITGQSKIDIVLLHFEARGTRGLTPIRIQNSTPKSRSAEPEKTFNSG